LFSVELIVAEAQILVCLGHEYYCMSKCGYEREEKYYAQY